MNRQLDLNGANFLESLFPAFSTAHPELIMEDALVTGFMEACLPGPQQGT